jgi:hypothetical protein
MSVRPGDHLRSACSETEVIVVRGPSGETVIACGGAAMVPNVPDSSPTGTSEPSGLTLLGKRYEDAESGLELLCVKAGAGILTCSGRVMPIREAKPLPSSD